MSLQDRKQVHFLTLPSVITQKILDHADVSTLRRLRGVCFESKSWVESPTCLNRIKLYVKSEKRLKEIMKSNVKWSYAVVPASLWNDKLAPFLQQFPLTRIKIVRSPWLCEYIEENFSISPKTFMSTFLHLKPHTLEYLSIRTSISSGYQYDHYLYLIEHPPVNLEEFDEWLALSLNGLKKIFYSLQILEMRKMSDHENALGNFPYYILGRQIFFALLKVCQNLVYLEIPFIHSENGPNSEETRKELQILFEYLDSPASNSLLTIDFGRMPSSQSRRWLYKDLCRTTLCKLNPNTLLRLARWCEPRKCQLLNVEATAFASATGWRDRDQARFMKIVKSVRVHSKTGIPGPNDVWIPPTAQLNLAFFMPNYWGVVITHSGFDLKMHCNIRTLFINFEDYEFKPEYPLELLLNPLPTLTKLVIYFPGCIPGDGFKFVSICPNLKKLHLHRILDSDRLLGDDGLLHGLANLEELTFERCVVSSSLVLFGNGICSPYLRQFANLRRVKLIECSASSIG